MKTSIWLLAFLLVAQRAWGASAISATYPNSHCTIATGTSCACNSGAAVVSGTCTSSSCPGVGDSCTPFPLDGASFRSNITSPLITEIDSKIVGPTGGSTVSRGIVLYNDTTGLKAAKDNSWLIPSGVLTHTGTSSGGFLDIYNNSGEGLGMDAHALLSLNSLVTSGIMLAMTNSGGVEGDVAFMDLSFGGVTKFRIDTAGNVTAKSFDSPAATSTGGCVTLKEGSANGSNTTKICVPANLASDKVITTDNSGNIALTDTYGTLAASRGGTGQTSVSDDTLLVGNGTSFTSTSIPDCDGATSALEYDTTTNALSCRSISSVGAHNLLSSTHSDTTAGGATDDSVVMGNGTVWAAKVIPDCDDSAGNHLNYDTATNTWTCGTTASSTLPSVVEDAVMVGTSSSWTAKTLPDCDDTVGQHLNYDTTTNAWTCGTRVTEGKSLIHFRRAASTSTDAPRCFGSNLAGDVVSSFQIQDEGASSSSGTCWWFPTEIPYNVDPNGTWTYTLDYYTRDAGADGSKVVRFYNEYACRKNNDASLFQNLTAFGTTPQTDVALSTNVLNQFTQTGTINSTNCPAGADLVLHMQRDVTNAADTWNGLSIDVIGARIQKPLTDVVAQRASMATIATTSNTDAYVIVEQDGKITSADFTSLDALTADNTNYLTFSLTNLGQSGAGTTAMLAATDANTTKSTGGTGLTANARRTLTLHGTAGNLTVSKGDIIRLRAAASGTLVNTVTMPVFLLRFNGYIETYVRFTSCDAN